MSQLEPALCLLRSVSMSQSDHTELSHGDESYAACVDIQSDWPELFKFGMCV
jgi:hypothetical protein